MMQLKSAEAAHQSRTVGLEISGRMAGSDMESSRVGNAGQHVRTAPHTCVCLLDNGRVEVISLHVSQIISIDSGVCLQTMSVRT